MKNEMNPGSAAENSAGEPPPSGGEAPAKSAGSASEITEEELAELRAKASKAEEHWDRYVRVSADLDNFKKRAARERTEAIRYANEGVLEKLLPIVDNFEAALAAANSSSTNVDSLKMGIQMIYTQLKSYLSDSGIEEIDATGRMFDPNLHEAVSQLASADAPEGQVVQQMRKGYKYRERLIRPAMVVVAKKP